MTAQKVLEKHVVVAVSEAVAAAAAAAAAVVVAVVPGAPVPSFHAVVACGSCSCRRLLLLMGTVEVGLAETGCGPAESETGYDLVAGGLAMPSIDSFAGCSVGDR